MNRLNQASRNGGNDAMDAADGIFTINLNREHLPRTRNPAGRDLYDRFIGPAVDALEEHMPPRRPRPPLQDNPGPGPSHLLGTGDRPNSYYYRRVPNGPGIAI